MQTRSTKNAFSLIELSIVILIIGILVIGISKGATLIRSSRLKSAQSLTASAPVASTPDLMMWLETTAEKSFLDSEEIDTALGSNGTITTWNDINPQSLSPNNATQPGLASLRARYIRNGINGLPSLNFDGTDDFMNLPTATTLGIVNSDYEFFVVYKSRTTATVQFLLAGPANEMYEIHMGNGTNVRFIPNGGSNFSDLTVPNILATHVVSGRVQNNRGIVRVDGTDTADIENNSRSTTTGALLIGKRSDNTLVMNGEIGEIILFKRALRNSERTGIEKYLKDKWGIR